jgi:hypothetical protein
MMNDVQSVRNTLGSDYLNIVFGWQPVIQEAANLIKVGMTLERAIYYESFRRKRAWDGPSIEEYSDVDIVSISSTGRMFGNYSHGGTGTSTDKGASITFRRNTRWTLRSENYRFTSRYTGLAKPTLRANRHTDAALDIVQRIGLVDDPRVLWDLMPWSWLVDWFTTMGASVSNASRYSPSRGKYAIDYAYLTTKHTVSEKLSLGEYQKVVENLSWQIDRANALATSVSLWRDRATPFGFGTQMGSINASQFAILVALGLAQSR